MVYDVVVVGGGPAGLTAGPGRPLLIIGGPRFDPQLAAELGVDKIFGKGTTPRDVASYLVHRLAPAQAVSGGPARTAAPPPYQGTPCGIG